MSIFSALNILPYEQRSKFWLLLLLMTLSGIIDVIGIASILPFITLVSNPEIIDNYEVFLLKFSFFDSLDNQEILVFFGMFSLFLFALSILTKGILTYLQLRFAYRSEHLISIELINKYLNSEYEWIVSQNITELVKNMLAELQQYIITALLPLLRLVSQSIASIFIIIFLLIYNAQVSLFSSFILVGAFLIIFFALKGKIANLGSLRIKKNDERYIFATEALSLHNISHVNMLSKYLLNRYSEPSKEHAKIFSDIQIFSQIPRYFLEFLAFGGVIALIIFMLVNNNALLKDLLPTLSIFSLAGYRLLPALQQVFSSATQLRSAHSIISRINDLLLTPQIYRKDRKFIEKWRTIDIKNISFYYKNSNKKLISNLNLTLSKGRVYGVSGPSGAGKSTLINILLGLIHPKSISIEVDGIKLNNVTCLCDFLKVSYVPQSPYFIDDTIGANIALGEDFSNADFNKILVNINIAQLNDLIFKQFDKNINTKIGENANLLSGGEKQRLGIARALYKESDILILDESTNALDKDNEIQLLKTLKFHCANKSLIVISHSSDLLEYCDEIIYLKG